MWSPLFCIQHQSDSSSPLIDDKNSQVSGPLTQKFTSLQKVANTSDNKINNYDVMGFLFKQQMKYQSEQDIAFERREKRKEENQRKFQQMILNNFKQ